MKFKAPSDQPVYIAMLSGHSAVIGVEWRELPVFMHREALAAGCITDNMDAETIAAKIDHAAPKDSNHDILVRAIRAMMDNPKEGDFTNADLPNLKALSKVVGWTVNKEEMMQAVHAIASEGEDEPV